MMFDRYKNYIENLNPLKFLRHVFRLNPENNWILLVLVFILINLFLIGSNILMLYNIISGELLLVLDDSNRTENQTVSRGDLNNTLSDFRMLKVNHDDLKNSKPSFIDPSI